MAGEAGISFAKRLPNLKGDPAVDSSDECPLSRVNLCLDDLCDHFRRFSIAEDNFSESAARLSAEIDRRTCDMADLVHRRIRADVASFCAARIWR